ncbi:MAG: fasciclin domain-containing protein [Actinobacteria bacterium]|nr:fasciclin domain-containing protein [Actinomycetota bacterium]NIY11972.1 fasciclin domain-containing protein [Gemmatimonadota bacterium]NIS35582.1 fasciclin domain-containing protein [Actinomycetota bacterium]NIT98203.1 fasciclin domain-containing protein [Actinomycetota bacterium]NIU21836.1 fasciclin domain-containing protein [Actinomycetota bacterium]
MALTLALALVAVACGDDGASTTTTTEAATATTTTTTEAMPEMLDIVDTAAGVEDFSTLVAAVQAAGLVDTLKGEGPFTVFAPTDEAFDAALDALGLTAEELLADTETLTDILLYHVVPGAVFAADVVGLEAATTAQGSDIAISVDGGVFLNETIEVIETDIEATNGVIHVIDGVLLPPADH